MSVLVRNKLIRASAGTGKTYQLSSRFIQLIAVGSSPERILATTFTRKAAGEILDRVVERLAKSVLSADVADETAKSIDVDQDSQFFGIQLEKMIERLNQLQIGTLDAFFAQVARAFTLEIGLKPDWRIIEETDMDLIKDEAIRLLLAQRDAREIIYLLAKGDADISIGRMVRNTIDKLYETYLQADESAWTKIAPASKSYESDLIKLEQDFLDVAAQSGTRVANALRNDLDSIVIRDWKPVLGRKVAENILSGENIYFGKPLEQSVIDLYQRLFKTICDAELGLLSMQNQGAFRLLDSYHQIYVTLENENGALRFDSVNRRVSELMETSDTEQVNVRLDQQISHLLLDEFQDTSLTQWNVLEPFAQEAIANQSDGSLFCVGDTKQAIYGWRGGVAELFDDVESKLPADSVENLVTSRRSAPEILDVVNRVFEQAGEQDHWDDLAEPIKKWRNRFEQHDAHDQHKPGYVCVERAGDDRDDGQGTLPFAAKRIQALATEHHNKSVGVLVRTNKIVAELIFYLGLLGVKASEEGGNPLLDSAAVNLVCSLLHLIDHPGDQVAQFHVAHSPLGESLGIPSDIESRQSIELTTSICQEQRHLIARHGVGPAIESWAKVLFPECTLRERTRLNQLVEMGFGYGDEDSSLSVFKQRIENSKVDDPSGADIRVMTIHQAKGLEFDVVVLPHLDCSLTSTQNDFVVGRENPTGPVTSVCKYVDKKLHPLLPSDVRAAFHNHIEREVAGELCLLYVAMTRAIHALHMIVAPDAKPTHKKWHGLVLSMLTPQQDSGVLWETGNSNWQSACSPETAEDEIVGSLLGSNPFEDYSYTDSIKTNPNGRHRMLEFTSPSRAEGGDTIEVDEILRSGVETAGMGFGTLIHACFETVEWLEEEVDLDLVYKRLSEITEIDNAEKDQAIKMFQTYVQQPKTRQFLEKEWFEKNIDLLGNHSSSGFRFLDVENERPFAILQNGELVQGFIDRLVVLSDAGKPVGAAVIDFKTDAIDRHGSQQYDDRVRFYRPQIEGYRRAAARFLGLEVNQVSGYLMFLAIDEIQQIK